MHATVKRRIRRFLNQLTMWKKEARRLSGGQEINKAIAGKHKPLSAEIVTYGAEQNSYHYEAIYQRTLGSSERISPAWNSQSDRLSEVLSVFYRMTN